jgi:hypothetical protein
MTFLTTLKLISRTTSRDDNKTPSRWSNKSDVPASSDATIGQQLAPKHPAVSHDQSCSSWCSNPSFAKVIEDANQVPNKSTDQRLILLFVTLALSK